MESDVPRDNILIVQPMCCQPWSRGIWIRIDTSLGGGEGERCTEPTSFPEEGEPCFAL